MRQKIGFAAIVVLLLGVPARSAVVAASDFIQVLGSVNSVGPVAEAIVVAFNLSTFSTSQTFTDAAGSFTLPPLPAGVYRIVAFKQGFAPAVATVMPNKKSHKIALRLSPASAVNEEAAQQIWEIRRSLPEDVLRQLDNVMAALPQTATPRASRFAGNVVSMTAMEPQQSPALAETALAIRGDLGSGWGVGFEGRRQSVGQSVDGPVVVSAGSDSVGQSTGMVLEVQSSPRNTYRIISSSASWRDANNSDSRAAVDLRSHSIEWKGTDSDVELHYLAHQNLFPNTDSSGEVVEIAGDTRLYRNDLNDFGVTLRVAQDVSQRSMLSMPDRRTADVMTNGHVSVYHGLLFDYGVVARMTGDSVEWIPQTGAAVHIGKRGSISVSGLYKLSDERGGVWRMPTLLFIGQDASQACRYRYAVGFGFGDPHHLRVEGNASLSAVDAMSRVMFQDGFDQFWDGFYVDAGDLRRDLTVAVRKELASGLAVGVNAFAGRAQNPAAPEEEKSYLTTNVETIYEPSGTSVQVAYRYLDRPAERSHGLAETQRVNLRVGQLLWMPLDLRLLVGIDLARGSAYEGERAVNENVQRRLVGGVSLAF
jgi:Carboxypeptidase regulatory-like domain